MTPGRADLSGLRLLVVEDNYLMAEVLADTLGDFGCEVVGPAPDVATGRELARDSELDGALLDINLFGEFCFPIARVLSDRGIPYIFVTGYDSTSMIPPEFARVPRLAKPVETSHLATAIAECFLNAHRTAPRAGGTARRVPVR